METVQLEQIANNLMAKLEPACVEVLNQGANFVATIRSTDIREVTIALLLAGAFLSAANFLLTFSHNMAIIQYPMGYLIVNVLK